MTCKPSPDIWAEPWRGNIETQRNRKKRHRGMILKRAEETSKITNVIFRKLRKEIECMKPYKMILKKKRTIETQARTLWKLKAWLLKFKMKRPSGRVICEGHSFTKVIPWRSFELK